MYGIGINYAKELAASFKLSGITKLDAVVTQKLKLIQ